MGNCSFVSGWVISTAPLSSEQTFLIAACKKWINDPSPVRVNRYDACLESQGRQTGVVKVRRVDPGGERLRVRERAWQRTSEGQTGNETEAGRWETGLWRERQVQFTGWEGGAACRRTAALLCNRGKLTKQTNTSRNKPSAGTEWSQFLIKKTVNYIQLYRTGSPLNQ